MAEWWQLDYGYKVKILEGGNKGKKGYIVMENSKYVGVSFDSKPLLGIYYVTEKPSNLEIISMSNPHNIGIKSSEMSTFDYEKLKLLQNNPQEILKEENKKYFDKGLIESANKFLDT